MNSRYISDSYTRLLSREVLFTHSKESECECEYCDSKLLQVGFGYEEGQVKVPLYRCTDCKYYEMIVNDNNNGIIRKVTKMY